MIEWIIAAILHMQAMQVDADECARYEQLAMIEQARAEAAETAYEAEYYEEWYWEPYPYDYGYTGDYSAYDTSDGITASEFQWLGVIQDGGTRYTWYSQNVLPGGGLTELNENGRHVEGGYVMDGDGYIAVASSDHPKGTVLDTPFGQAKVYDTGCASGTVDVFVGW